ncbi:MAG TPA: serine/threonine-protein kinase, partial [Planctomycetota bacterium]|nr:serine/threonine-protein kinase [Planctomycetota bacterium]
MKEVGGYTLGAKLGEGGMGAVYRATHPRFPGREFALKLLLSDRKPAPSAVERFSREMRALAVTNQHPGIVKLLGGSLEATPFLVMELVNGTSLDKLAGPGGLEPKRAARIVREVADAVAYAHGQGIVHRDLKPQNIIVEDGDRPRVCDFGLARVADEERLTRSGTFMGTPAFSAPEQLDGRAHLATERADVYGLGAVLYFALAGQQPFTGSGGEVTRRVLLERPKPPSSVREGVPHELDAICGKALEKLPIRRYPSAEALRDELDRFLAGEPIETRPPGRVQLAVRALAERRGLAIVVALLLLAVLATAGGLLLTELRLRERQRRLGELAAHLVAPGATLDELERGLTELPRGSDELAAVELRREEAKLADAVRATGPGALPLAQLLDLARDARLVLEKRPDLAAVSLVGERSDLPPLGLLLLDRRRVETRSVEGREKLLAAARALATVASGPGKHALQAYVELAGRGAPTAALGPGRLGVVTPEAIAAVRPDLEAASHLPGAAGARAAWLLADLLVLANDREARGAIDRAAASAPSEVQPILDASLDDDRDPATVLADLGPRASDPKLALRLSRYLARQGLAGALEAPELAATPTRTALDAVLATDPPIAFEPRFAGP